MKRLRAEALKARILEVMAAMAARRPDQHEFTAQRVAIACGVSTTLLYRLASDEFRAYRAGLPGGLSRSDAVMASLRSRLRDAGNEIDRLERLERLHSSCPSLEDVSLALEANERLEEENRTLRAQLEQLRRRGRPILRRLE